MLHYLKEFYKFAKGGVIFYIISTFVTGLLEGVGISLLIPTLNFFMESDTETKFTRYFKNAFEYLSVDFTIQNVLLALILVFLLKMLTNLVVFYYRMSIREFLKNKLQSSYVRQLCHVKYSWFKKEHESHINNVLVNEVNFVVDAFDKSSKVITAVLNLLVYVVSFLLINDLNSLLYIAPFGLLLPVLFGLSKAIKKKSKLVTEINNNVQEYFFQIIRGFKYLKVKNGYESFTSRLENLFSKRRKTSVSVFLLVNTPSLLSEFLGVVFVSGLIWILVVKNNRAISDILIIIVFVQRMLTNLVNVISNRNSFWANIGSLNKYYEQFGEMEKMIDVPSLEQKPLSACSESFYEFKNVSFKFDDQDIISNLSFKLKKGELIGLVGASGGGKTTLFDLALGLLKPYAGDIYLNGKNLENYTKEEIAKRIGYVPQEPVIFNESLESNINWNKSDNALSTKIENGISNFIELSKDTAEGDKFKSFSGGQKQKIAFFRELAQQPDILLVDEGTSAMDSHSEKEFTEYVNEAKKNSSIIMIAHRLSSLKDCDNIMVLNKGKIVEVGNWSELTSISNGYFNRLLKHQEVN